MKAIFIKEIKQLFSGGFAWFLAAAFVLLCGIGLLIIKSGFNILQAGIADLQSFFNLFPWILSVLIPALAMRSVSEEKTTGTLHWLFAQPISSLQIVAGKFFAIWIVSCLFLLPVFLYFGMLYTLAIPYGNIDGGVILANIIGSIGIMGVFSAIGIWASAISPNSIVSIIVAIGLCFLLYFGLYYIASSYFQSGIGVFLRNISLFSNYQNFAKGIFDIPCILYFALLTYGFLYLAKSSLQSQKQLG